MFHFFVLDKIGFDWMFSLLSGLFSREAMENYKSLEAHTFFTSGFVETIEHIKSTTGTFVFRASVRRSWRVTDEPHHTWVAVKENGSVASAHCTCMAG